MQGLDTNNATPVKLEGVPETMLWTLHNRANEAIRPDGILRDPEAVRIYRSIDHDFSRSFGEPDGSHAVRSRIFDEVVQPWMASHPGATVVELAAGLETQFQRVDDGEVRWVCVDVPEAIRVRERFLPATDRCRYVGKSALDSSWMDEVDSDRPVLVTAQGLFMYFEERDVRALVTGMFDRFPGMELVFDTIPPWFSRKTLKGFRKTKHYQAPPMPWGVHRREIEALLRSWSPRVASVRQVPFGFLRGIKGVLLPLFSRFAFLQDLLPSITHVRTRKS